LPLSGAQRWLTPRAPSIVAGLIISVICISMAWQTQAWQQRLQRLPDSAAGSSSQVSSLPAQTSLLPLFANAQQDSGNVVPSTNLRLTLMGSFVHVDPAHSSAIIAREGSKAKRYQIGEQLSDGVLLHAVYLDKVELQRNGRLETLAFKLRAAHASAPNHLLPTPNQNIEQLQQFEEENGNQLRQRMQALQQQMQMSETPVDATTEQPTESD
jgi:general secretion pathway protein C